MAEETGLAKLDEVLSKLTALQENHTRLFKKQNNNMECLTNSMKELKIGLQNLDAKVEQYIHRTQNLTPKPQVQSTASPNLHQQGPNPDPEYSNQLQLMRLEIPRFSGENLSAWITCTERYFNFYNTPDSRRVLIASFYLDGQALDWYDWMRKNQFITCWHDFLLALVKRFRPSEYVDYVGKLNKLLPFGTFTDSHHLFDQLSTKIIGVPEPTAESFKVDSTNTTQEETHENSEEATNEGIFKGRTDSRSINLPPLLPNPSSDNLPKPVKTQPLVTVKKLSVEEVHYQILREAWVHIEHLNGEQKRRKTSEYFLVSAVAEFNGPQPVLVFSWPAISITNQPVLTLLAIINCPKINDIDRGGSLRYWFSGTGCRWKNPGRACQLWSTYSDFHLEDKVFFDEEGNDTIVTFM